MKGFKQCYEFATKRDSQYKVKPTVTIQFCQIPSVIIAAGNSLIELY